MRWLLLMAGIGCGEGEKKKETAPEVEKPVVVVDAGVVGDAGVKGTDIAVPEPILE
jgi:hypothetical protein